MPPVVHRSYRDFATRRVVIEKVVDRRLGPESPNPPDSWRWDYKHFIGDNIPEALPFPGLKRSHLMGLPRSYWQNGPISGREGNSIKVEEVIEIFTEGKTRWAPVIHNGDLNIWRDGTYFFSDDSVVETLDSSITQAGVRSLHVLEKVLRPGSPILATIFCRDQNNEYLPWRSYNRREHFTGLLDSDGVEQTTRSGDTFTWTAVDTSKREFVSYLKDDSVYLLFNQIAIEPITEVTVPVVVDDFNDLEYLGTSDGTNSQVFKTKYFPVSDDSVLEVYAVNIYTGVWSTLSVVSSFDAANQVVLDADLGVLTFGSGVGLSLPPDAGLALYIAYNATPRIEYEEEGYSEVAIASDADVNPLGQSMNRGFVTLARAELDVGSIVLETTKDAYAGIGTSFGPVYVGSDYAPLYATVYSSGGEVVPNVEVTFFFQSSDPFGGLGGGGSTSERRTGFDGIARSYYVPPSTVEDMGFYVEAVTGGNSLTLPTNANFVVTDDIYTYYVLKDDPFIGVAGADTARGEIEWDPVVLNGRKVISYKWDAGALNPISGHLGAYSPVRPTSIGGGNILYYTDVLSTPSSVGYGASLETGTVTSASLDSLTDSAKAWTTNAYDHHVVYNAGLGEYRRVRSNNANTLILYGEWSDIPTGAFTIYSRTVNLGAYWVVSDRYVTVRASAYSPILGRTVYSNDLTLRIEIPDYLKGSYISDSLQEIPFGFRILDTTYDVASAIDGATYISINPVAGPYPIVDVIGGETWDPYSGPYANDGPYPFWPYGAYPSEGASAPFAHFAIFWDIV